MRNKNNKHLGIEIDPELHYKLHYISKYYGRSANGEILFLIYNLLAHIFDDYILNKLCMVG